MNVHVALLLFVTLVWGATFPILKVATVSLSGIEVSALRFLIAAACMLPWALRASTRAWRDGALLSCMLLTSYVAQAYGLQFISSNRSAFLTSLNVLMVPLFGLAFGNKISPRVFMAAVLALIGIGLISWDGGSHLVADTATLVSAATFAIYVIALSAMAARHSARHLAATQTVCMAVLGVLWMIAAASGTDKLQTLADRVDVEIFLGLAYLGVVATAGMLFIQAIAQRHVSADKAAVIYAMEPVFATMFAWWWLSEILTLKAAVGGAILVFAVVFSEWNPAPKNQAT